MNLYEMLKDHPRFPKARYSKYSGQHFEINKGNNQCLQEVIEFLKSVWVDEEKLKKLIENGRVVFPSRIEKLVKTLCQENIIGDK